MTVSTRFLCLSQASEKKIKCNFILLFSHLALPLQGNGNDES